jgi:uncharacterized protein (DUF1800 family)
MTMKTTFNCASGTLAPYTPSAERPWDKRRAMHLLRRMAFNVSPQILEEALKVSPSAIVDFIIDQSLQQELPTPPVWANWTINDYQDFNAQREEQYKEWSCRWLADMIQGGFKEKLELFWHNHFVTKYEAYECTTHMVQYHMIIKENALGNFKTLVEKIGTTPAMLVFLNGVQNTNLQPNENYARELFELFTLGRDNGYNQDDIEEAARALTGWVGYFAGCGPIGFVQEYHDNGEKTIFGRTGQWGYQALHDILFEERADEISNYICRKIYQHFVHPQVDEFIVSEMGKTLRDHNFELVPVLRQLFKSEHFFDEYVIGTQIKSPVDYFIGFIRQGPFSLNEELLTGILFYSFLLGQHLFNPVDVAGWPGNRSWINNNYITLRWQAMDLYLYFLFENYPQEYRAFLTGLLPATTDPQEATRVIVDHILPNGLEKEEDYLRATQVFKHEIPQNYFDNNLWNLNWDTIPAQVALLMQYIIKLPEYQLQ